MVEFFLTHLPLPRLYGHALDFENVEFCAENHLVPMIIVKRKLGKCLNWHTPTSATPIRPVPPMWPRPRFENTYFWAENYIVFISTVTQKSRFYKCLILKRFSQLAKNWQIFSVFRLVSAFEMCSVICDEHVCMWIV